MDSNTWLTFVQTVGFPSALAAFLIWNLVGSFQKAVEANTAAIKALGDKIDAGNAERRTDSGNLQRELMAQTFLLQHDRVGDKKQE